MLRDICLKKRYSKLKKMNLYCSLDNLTYQDFIGNSTPETRLTVYLQTPHTAVTYCAYLRVVGSGWFSFWHRLKHYQRWR